MYHHTNLGKFATHVQQFADLGGYVPEPGDSVDEFGWEDPPHDWEGFVADAAHETARANLLASLWQCDHTPDPDTTRDIRSFLGLTQTEFGDCLGVGLRHVQKWEAGDRNVSETAGRLMASLVREG